MHAAPFALAALLLVPAVGRAEVRLVRGDQGPKLAIKPSPGGAWMPLGGIDKLTVNPGGDLLGDGFPGQCTANGKLLAAWQRPAVGGVVVLRADSAKTYSTVEVPSAPGMGTPIIAADDGAWLIAWVAGYVDPVVLSAVATNDELGEPVSIAAGELIDVIKLGSALHVVTFQRSGHTLTIATYPTSHEPSPLPVPISRTLRLPLGELIGVFQLDSTLHVVSLQPASSALTIVSYPHLDEPDANPIPIERTVPLLSAESVIDECASVGRLAMPVFTTLDVATLVTWQAIGDDERVMAVVATETGTSDPVDVIAGKLLGVHRIGDAVHVLSYLATDASLLVATYLDLHLPDPIPVPTLRTLVPLAYVPSPIPIPLDWEPLPIPIGLGYVPNPIRVPPGWVPLPIPIGLSWEPNPIPVPPGWVANPIPIGLTWVGNPIPVPTSWEPLPLPIPHSWDPNPLPIPTTYLPHALAIPPGAHAASASAQTWQPCVEVRDDDVLVAWQAGHGQVGRVLLTEYGVDGEGEFLRGPNGSCEALLNAASRH